MLTLVKSRKGCSKMKYSHKKCQEIIELPPGSRIESGGKTWIRMHDAADHHLEDYFFDPESGEYYHASRIFSEETKRGK